MEKDTIKNALLGDKDALAEIITEYQDWIHKWALKIVRRTEDAEDITQEVSMKILTSLSTLQEESKIASWVYRITYHASLNWLRLRKKTTPLGDIEVEDTSDNNLVSLNLEKQENIEKLYKALDELPMAYRLIINMYFFESKSYEEIAETLKIPMGTVKTNLFRAKEMLKEKLSIPPETKE
jgi:RNA polymerase sigma-70 factor (ECF subfamily)